MLTIPPAFFAPHGFADLGALQGRPLLLGPGIRQGFGEAGDCEIAGAVPSAIAAMIRGERKARGASSRMSFAYCFPFGNPGEGGNAAEPDIVDPSPGLGDSGKQGVPAFGQHVVMPNKGDSLLREP
jgi:hypothetical protein